MEVINGKEIAQKIIQSLKNEPKPQKIFAVASVRGNSASESFLKQKEKIAKELGIDFRLYEFDKGLLQDDLRKEVVKISRLKKVGGVIVQLPLPGHINNQYVLNAIPREKDIDVLGERALGAFYANRNIVLPPAVGAMEEILKTKNYQLKAARVAVVGLGQLVGKPISVWLIKKCKELYLLDRESDLKILKQADLVICGIGKAGIIKPIMLKDGASVIDFGYERNEGQQGSIVGDFNVSEIENNRKLEIKNSWYTPTPGGTGPVLVAKIFENFYTLNKVL